MSVRAAHIRHAAAAFCMLALSPLLMPAVGQSVEQSFRDGLRAFEAGEYATALRHWVPLAQKGEAAAQFNLGRMYEKGQGVPQDYEEAVRWYRLAAKQGYADPQINLGVMYALGQGVRQDWVTAYMWARVGQANGASGELAGLIREQLTDEQVSEGLLRRNACVRSGYRDCD